MLDSKALHHENICAVLMVKIVSHIGSISILDGAGNSSKVIPDAPPSSIS
jgi:hypothetical protein